MSKLSPCLALFSRDLGQASAPRGLGPVVVEAQRSLKSWGLQVELAEEFKKCMSLLRSSDTGLSDLLDQDVLSLESLDPADSMLLAPSSQNEADLVDEGKDIACSVPSQPASPAYEVMACTTTRLGLVWGHERQKTFFLMHQSRPQNFSAHLKTVVGKFREASERSVAFRKYFLSWSKSSPKTSGGPGPSQSEDWQDQREIVASLSPPSRSRAKRR